jgi:predicted ATPase
MARREIEAMINRVAGDKAMPASIWREIIERADGIPLFIEEITKAVLEAGSQGASERIVAAIPSAAVEVPATLHALLMTRLDRLGGSAKEVAQIGAAMGREFPYALMASVALKLEDEVQAALDRLTETGLLLKQGVLPHATYLFKHTLVQDAAYSTLLRESKRALHARIGENDTVPIQRDCQQSA